MNLFSAGVKHFLLCAVFTAAVSHGLFSAPLSGEAWKLLDIAQQALESGDYGTALKRCEEARLAHRSLVGGYIADLEVSFSPLEVRKAGDELTAVYQVIVTRNDMVAKTILDSVFLNYPVSRFGNSASSLMKWLSTRMVYPEADFLEGNVYRAEGEYNLALSFYEKAWIDREGFDIPDERFSLAYAMADLAEAMGKFGDQEKYLLLVVKEDALFGLPGNEPPTLNAILRTLSSESSLDKFFGLYRHYNTVALPAYNRLSRLYMNSNLPERALPAAALGAIIAVSSLSQALSGRDFEWVYSGFPGILSDAGKNSRIAEWARDSEIWAMLDTFAAVLLSLNKDSLAESVYSDLARFCSDSDVSRRASVVLESMRQKRLQGHR